MNLLRRFFGLEPNRQNIPPPPPNQLVGDEQIFQAIEERNVANRDGPARQFKRPARKGMIGLHRKRGGVGLRNGGYVQVRERRSYSPYKVPNRDTVKAILAPGELVIPRDLTEKLAKLINTRVYLKPK